MEEIRIGIIGHGFMGHEHEKMLTELEGFRVVGISDGACICWTRFCG